MDNSSGQGAAAIVPAEIDRWNWGAFLLNWIWGIGNSTFIALLMFVPLVNLVMPFVLGVKGSTWAWRNKRWDSVEHFQRVQRVWAIVGVIVLIGLIGFTVGVYFFVSALLKHSEAYQMGMAELQQNPAVVAALGKPITGGAPSGRLQTSGPSGSADLQISVAGPKGQGTAYLHAVKTMGAWKLERLEVQVEGRRDRIIVLGSGEKVMLRQRWQVGHAGSLRYAAFRRKLAEPLRA